MGNIWKRRGAAAEAWSPASANLGSLGDARHHFIAGATRIKLKSLYAFVLDQAGDYAISIANSG